ncbi:MAG: ribosome biogenesis GTPase Der [Pseudomonadota bacterium]|nr:ribosome biogenesis GTPase Der [Pseudomonadota bacterium]
MIPVVALVGRPNVGKSTLFNRLTNSRDALVADFAGLTRDRLYGEARFEDRRFIVIDTGGINGGEEGIDSVMAGQSLQAIEEADLVMLLVDARDGLTSGDEFIIEHLRKTQKPVSLVVNKIDGLDQDQVMNDFYRVGITDMHPIAASQGRGVHKLMEAFMERFPASGELQVADEKPGSVRIAVAGRPNVGKSTLVNRMLGEDRVVVYDQPGTTRDSIYIPFERHGKHFTLIDTAGIRKRGKTTELIEKFSIVKSLQAIQDAHVVILVLDAREGIVEQDLHLLGYVLETGRALVIGLNKWDGMDEYQKDLIKEAIRRRFVFVDFARIHFISALHGTGVGNLFDSVLRAHESAFKVITTSKMNQVLERAMSTHQPPLINGRRIKLRYAHVGGHNPPRFIIHGKQTEDLPDSYVRYLEKSFRKLLKLEGTPVRIELRSDDNPYTKEEKGLDYQQVARKRRIVKNRQFLREKRGGKGK